MTCLLLWALASLEESYVDPLEEVKEALILKQKVYGCGGGHYREARSIVI